MSSAVVLPDEVMALITGWQAVAQALLKTVKLLTAPEPRAPGLCEVAAMPTRMLGPMGMVMAAPTWVQVTPLGEL
jgi:hypothetical protein